tara:strand:+ start:4268 stop:5023 length:756 start_codon:yes stop_codon:yes gene_type:complete
MAEIHFDFLNFNTILLLLLILLIGGYLYYEIHKMKITLNDIHNKLNYLLDNNIPSEEPLNSISSMNKDILNEEILNEEILNEGIVNVKPNEVLNVKSNEQVGNIQRSENKEDLKRQMMDDQESSDDSHSESSDDNRSESSDSESRISQSEIEKDYGKNVFEQENNNASIDDILSDKHIITDNSLSDILNVDSDLTKIDEFIQNIKSDKEEIKQKDYNDMTVSELKKVLVDMKLPVSGNKTKLVERILENKK